MSEDEIARQGGGRNEADAADEYSLGDHSLVTPLATRATSAKTASVMTTKARSAIADSWDEVRKVEGRLEQNACQTGFGHLLTPPLRRAALP
ncbi:hypothetical protein [Streptomyces pseudovenezuelae]|uniref:Uncharacterized protein n=1 Tax=Streptomyces pseudovenezuelae TaxID=67350 RepID=A0ABT6LF19_9ACTN|nr:hypothetical protein [Streptomyces pseudovenezuelae]MDH6214908.1 hypothetical protein [Streptomyces pseudovenezuelae]